MKKQFFSLLASVIFLICNVVSAQTFYYGTGVITGNPAAGTATQSVSGNDVTITASGTMLSGTYNFNNFTINAGVAVTVSGGSGPLIIYCTGTCTVNGTLSWNGNNGGNAATNTAGAAGTNNGWGAAGGAGSAGTNGLSLPTAASGSNFATSTGSGGGGNAFVGNAGGGGGAAYSLTGAGGADGASGGGGGAAGIVYGGTTDASGFPTTVMTSGAFTTHLLGGSGGGGGAGGANGTAGNRRAGGGGGGGGGAMQITAGTLTFGGSGLLSASGGNGGASGTSASVNGGGGGAGSGGTIFLQYLSGNYTSGNATVTGGTGGAGGSTGGGGGNGGAGRIYTMTDAAPCSGAPTIQASALSASSTTTINSSLSWTRGNGDNVLVIARKGGPVNYYPTDGVDYAAGANSYFGSGTLLGADNYVLYSGTGTSVTVSGLLGNTNYQFAVIEYTTSGFCYYKPVPAASGSTTSITTLNVLDYRSSTTVQVTGAVALSSNNQAIIQIPVVTTGATGTLNATSLNINVNGSTSLSDISAINVYYTTTTTFATTNLFGTASVASGTLTVTGTRALAAGNNYFWIAFNVPAGANYGDLLDAECTSITVGGNTYTPTLTAPAGDRLISPGGTGIPITYYDFELNSNRTTLETTPEVALNATGNSITIWSGATVSGGAGRGANYGGAAGLGLQVTLNAASAGFQVSPPNYIDFAFNTTGFRGLTMKIDINRQAGTYAYDDYNISADGGATWVLLSTFESGSNGWLARSVALPSNCENNPTVVIRLYGTTGSTASYFIIDNFSIYANSTITSAGTRTFPDFPQIYTGLTSGATGSMATYDNFMVIGSGTTVNMTASNIGLTGTFVVANNGTFNFGTAAVPTYEVSGVAGKIIVNPGATIGITDAAGISTSGASGNWQGTGTRTFSTAANYNYKGNTAQNTGSGLPATVNNLTIDNAAGVTLTNDVTVNGALGLSNGLLTLGAKNITVSSTGSVSGTPSSDKMVLTNSTGQFIKGYNTGASSFTYPIGDAGPNYTPVTLNFATNSSPGTVGLIAVNSQESNMTNPSTPAAYLTRYWTFSNTGLSTYTYTGTFTYPSANIVGTETAFRYSRWAGSDWYEATTGSSASAGVLTITDAIDETTAPLNGNVTGRAQNAACSAPSAQSNTFASSSLGTTSVTIEWIRPSSGAGDNVIVIARQGSAVNVNPVGGFSYNADANFGNNGAGYTTGSGNHVVYDGSGTSVNITGLTPSLQYYFAVYEYTAGECYAYNLTAPLTGNITTASCSPSTNASSYSGTAAATSINIAFTRGNGNRLMVVARQGSAVTTTGQSIYDQDFSAVANATYGTGTAQIGSTGNYVVYDGIGNGTNTSFNFNMNGLSQNTTYHFAVFEYTTGPNCYSIAPLTGNTLTLNPMVYATYSTTQNTTALFNNSTNQQIIGMQVVTTGGTNPRLTVNSILFNTNGTTTTADITNAKIYYTHTTSTFSASNLFGTVSSFTGGNYTLNGSQALDVGTNYFWIAYDIPSSAAGGDVVDAEIGTPELSGTTLNLTGTPTSAPSGNRGIAVGYGGCGTVSSGSPCFFGLYNFYVKTVSFGTLNFTNGTCLGDGTDDGYQDLYSTVSGTVTQGLSYTLTISRSGVSPECWILAWVDWNNDGDFNDANELIMSPTYFANLGGTTATTSVTVPMGATVGPHRMRVRTDGGDPTAAPNPCATTGFYGDTKDMLLNVIEGCTSPPTVNITPGGATTFCNGSSVGLTASGADSYAWAPADKVDYSNVASVNTATDATTTYTVTGTTGACHVTATVTVTVNPSVITFNPVTPSVSPGGNVSVTASATSTNGTVSFSWSPGTYLDVTSGATVTSSPLTSTTYTVTGTDGICSGTGTVTVGVNSGTPGTVSCGYSWAKSNGSTFALLSGATVLASGINSTTDDAIYTNQPIGFNFDFNGVTYSSLGVSTNGFVWFGSTNPATSEYTPISSSAGMEGVISVFGSDLRGALTTSSCNNYTSAIIGDGTVSLSIKTSGDSPNRTFTVQWHSFKAASSSSSCSVGDYQIVLKESDYSISFKYNNNAYFIDDSFTGQVGIRGRTNSDFNNRRVTCVTNVNWDDNSRNPHPGTSVAGTANTDICNIDGASCNLYPVETLVWTWTPTLATPSVTPSAPQSVCVGGAGVTLTANTTMSSPTYQWQTYTYPPSNTNVSGQTAGTYLANPSSAGTYYYVVKVTNGSGCSRTSYATPVVATNCCSTPDAPTGSSPQTFCSTPSPTVANLSATGTGIKWYAASSGGSPLSGSTTLSHGTHYFATQMNGECESTSRLDVTVLLTFVGAPTGSASQSFCTNASHTVADLSATGSGIQWYAAITGGSPLSGSTTLVNNTHYFASQTVSGCESINRLDVTASVASCSFNYTVTAFLQGYYLGGTMSPLLYIIDPSHHAATDVDTVTIELHNATSPFGLANSYTGILQKNGTVTVSMSVTGNYYVVIRHRNSITTWSASAVAVNASANSYNFTTGAGQALGSMVNLGSGVYGIYSGDVNLSDAIDGTDKTSMQSVLSTFAIGVYNANDITGDGFVDEDDYRILQNNLPLNISISHP